METLREGWAEVIETRNSSPRDCPCREVTGPLIEEWLAWNGDEKTADRQWSNLRAAQHAQRAPGALAPQCGDFQIDVRSRSEFARSPRAAVNIPIDELSGRLAEVPLGARLVVYCASGMRAARAVHLLRESGYRACNGHEPTCELPDLIEGSSAALWV